MSLVDVQAQTRESERIFLHLCGLCLCVAIATIQKLAYVPCRSIYVQSLVLCLEDVYSRSKLWYINTRKHNHHRVKGLIKCAARLQRLMYLVLIHLCGKVLIQSSTISGINLNTVGVCARSVCSQL